MAANVPGGKKWTSDGVPFWRIRTVLASAPMKTRRFVKRLRKQSLLGRIVE